jgi:hypothetical protein
MATGSAGHAAGSAGVDGQVSGGSAVSPQVLHAAVSEALDTGRTGAAVRSSPIQRSSGARGASVASMGSACTPVAEGVTRSSPIHGSSAAESASGTRWPTGSSSTSGSRSAATSAAIGGASTMPGSSGPGAGRGANGSLRRAAKVPLTDALRGAGGHSG